LKKKKKRNASISPILFHKTSSERRTGGEKFEENAKSRHSLEVDRGGAPTV